MVCIRQACSHERVSGCVPLQSRVRVPAHARAHKNVWLVALAGLYKISILLCRAVSVFFLSRPRFSCGWFSDAAWHTFSPVLARLFFADPCFSESVIDTHPPDRYIRLSKFLIVVSLLRCLFLAGATYEPFTSFPILCCLPLFLLSPSEYAPSNSECMNVGRGKND